MLKKIDYNAKITEIKDKTRDISNLATKTTLTTVENKIPNISNLATKFLVNKMENKLNNHNHDKYIDTSDFNKLAVDVFNARIAQANLMKKKQILMLNCQVLTEKLLKTKQNIYLLKMN